jgi:hypothetical protein
VKNVEDLVPLDFETHPVWEFVMDQEGEDDTSVRPFADLPVSNLANRLVGTRVRLANGKVVWALLGNLDLNHSKSTEHFRTISIFHDGRWLFLARYHDVDYETHGPSWLATTIGLKPADVFPIVYDIRYCSVGNPDAVVGTIEAEPKDKLTQSELISLAANTSGL